MGISVRSDFSEAGQLLNQFGTGFGETRGDVKRAPDGRIRFEKRKKILCSFARDGDLFAEADFAAVFKRRVEFFDIECEQDCAVR